MKVKPMSYKTAGISSVDQFMGVIALDYTSVRYFGATIDCPPQTRREFLNNITNGRRKGFTLSPPAK